MGLVEFLRQWERGRIAAGVGISILLHLVLVLLAVGIHLPGRVNVKRGEPLIVELPRGDDSPPPGDGGAPASKPSPPAAPPAPRMQARPTPPAPKVAAPPPQPSAPSRRSAPPAARPEPAPPRQVASAPAVQPAETGSVPAPQPTPAQPAPAQPAPPQPAPPQPSPADTPAAADSAPAESPAPQPAPKQVASLPPQPAGRPVPDALSALRRGSGGGAGGSGHGHAGIEGEPIPLDSTDPRYSDYLDQIRRRIKEKWGYPCEKNEQTKVCEYRSTQLLIDFGINKNGELAYVTLVRSSGHSIYDDYALNAVKLASPFPPIPDTFSKTGVPIKANFHYVLQSTLTNILR